MKKKSLLMLMASVLLPLSMGAQLKAPMANGLLEQMPGLKSLSSSTHMAPARVDLAENQRIMGHYDTEDLVDPGQGLGITGLPGTMPIATIIEPDEMAMFLGGKIVTFRVGLAQATPITRVFVAPVDAEGNLGEFTEWSCNTSLLGWNEIALETPYELNLDQNSSLMIGFDYTQTSSNYPISAVEVGDIYPSYCFIQNSWQNVGLDAYGNLSIQCVVEKDDFPAYALRIAGLRTHNFVKMGDDLDFTFKLKNGGIKTVEANAIVANVLIDGEVVGTVTNPVEVGSAFVDMAGVASTEGLEPGEHTLTVALATLNGEEIENPQSLDYTFKILTNSFPRQKHLVEQLTSTYCTYCPLGNSLLKLLTEQRNDVIWVGIHGNMNGTDPFRTAETDTILTYLTGGSVSYPSAVFDRTVGWEDDNTISNGIGYYEEYHQSVANDMSAFLDEINETTPTFATIGGEFIYPNTPFEDTCVVTVRGEVTPDFKEMMGEDARLTVYIIEDSLVARQLNNGRWVPKYVHNGVFRTAPTSVFGVPLNIEGENYTNEFKFKVNEAWDPNHLRAVAFISRPLSNAASGSFADMYVDNAEILDYAISIGVEEILVDGEVVPVAYYDIMGRQHDSLQPGINIVKMSNGTAKKLILK